MWHRLSEQIAVEREQLHRLLDSHQPVLVKSRVATPDAIECSALAALLHSFYTGIEGIFKRVLIETGEELPAGQKWHRELLTVVSQQSHKRPAVISAELATTLREYLDFRHVFRQAYAFEIRWEKMAHLVHNCPTTLDQLERELDAFLKSLGEA